MMNLKRISSYNMMLIFLGALLITQSWCNIAAASDYIVDPRCQYTYPVTEFLNDELFDQYRYDDGNLFHRLLTYYSKLTGSDEMPFISFASNPVELLYTGIPEQGVVNYGSDYASDSYYEIEGEQVVATEAIQVFEPFLDLFPLEIEEGRGFSEADHHYMQDRRIPVILGAAYKDTFHIGDAFEGYYISERVSFEVIGIAKSESIFFNKAEGGFSLYDRYIIMPFEQVTEDSLFSRIVLLQEICGFIVAENGWDAAVSQIQQCLAESGLTDWQDQIVVITRTVR